MILFHDPPDSWLKLKIGMIYAPRYPGPFAGYAVMHTEDGFTLNAYDVEGRSLDIPCAHLSDAWQRLARLIYADPRLVYRVPDANP